MEGWTLKKIPKYFINKIQDRAGRKAKELYEKIFDDSFDSFIEKVITEEIVNKDVQHVRLITFKNQFQRTKKRWFQSVKNSLEEKKEKRGRKTELQKELELAQSILDEYGIESFRQLYQVNSLEELKENRLKVLEEWVNDPEQMLFDYLYLKDKTPLQIEKAFRTDITLIVCNCLIQDFEGNLDGIITEKPHVLVDHPVYTEKRGKGDWLDETIQYDNKLYYYEKYAPSPGYHLLTLINKDFLDDPEFENKYTKALDDTDTNIFLAVMARRDVRFMVDRRIVVDIKDILKSAELSDGSFNYKHVIARLRKLANIKFNIRTKDDRLIVFGIFDNLEIENVSSGGTRATIIVNDVIQQQYIEEQVTKIYSDQVKQLEDGTSKNLIFYLQKQRMIYGLKKISEPYILTYNDCLFIMRFASNRKKDNLEVIESCLKKYIELGITVKSYKRSGSTFIIEFLPLEMYEIEDLIPADKEKPPLLSGEVL